MVGLLKQNVGSDSCFFQLSVVFHSSSGNIYVYPADSAVFMFDTVDSLNALQHIFNRTVHRIFSCFQRQSLMPHILKSDNLLTDFLLGQFLSGNMLILGMIWTVYTAVYTVIGQI